jgi:ribulose-5-phosphate 4-epimerase/fuculose-1-phosphate aldolase
MADDSALREQLATCTRILAMEGLIGMFGHVSAYDPASGRVLLCPGAGSDKATVQAADLFVLDREGRVLEGEGHVPIEWPIHTTLHAARADALAVAHVHAPFATLFSIARRPFHAVTFHASMFRDGVPLYSEAQLIKTPAKGNALVDVLGDRRAVLLRDHGLVVVARDLPEVLYATLVFEDNARKIMEAATLGELDPLTARECEEFETDAEMRRRVPLMWRYFARLEARWDRQPGSGRVGLS